ncbi:MAG: hypothetical protein SH868_02050 [Bythopirellula sp.]|nr:hypothetical protein [Bythopirellula sp.]
MVSDKFEIEPEEENRPERGCMGGCLKGCFMLVLIMVALVAVLGYVVSQNWRGWSASLANMVIGETLEASNLPPQEQQEIRDELDRPLDALQDGTLSIQQFDELAQVIIESPLMPSLAVSMIESHYFNQSTLTPEEKQAGGLALRRFVRGVIDQKIEEAQIEAVISHVADQEANDQWRFREKVSDEDLRRLIATAEQEADKAGVPAQVESVDPSDEIGKIIDAVMGPVEVEPEVAPNIP